MNLSKKHLPAEKRRIATVEAVVELAGEQNPNDITTAAIANRMGLTQGAIFRHFPNKEAILNAVMEWVAEQLTSKIEKAICSETSSLCALEKMFMAHVSFVTTHPGIPRMLFGELQNARETRTKHMVQMLIQRYKKKVQQLIKQGQLSGEINKDLDIEAASTLFLGMIQGLVIQSLIAGDTANIKREAPKVFTIYKQGLEDIS